MMSVEEAIKQLQTVLIINTKDREAINIATKALQTQLKPETNFDEWKSAIQLEDFKYSGIGEESAVFSDVTACLECPAFDECGDGRHLSCWEYFKIWAETKI